MARLSLAFVVAAFAAFAGVNAAALSANEGFVTTNVAPPKDAPAPVEKRDYTSAWSYYVQTYGRNVTGACGVPYGDNSHGACVGGTTANCGRRVYAYLGNGNKPQYQTAATVVDICDDLSPNSGIAFTLDSFEQLGGTIQEGEIPNVNWKYLS